MHISTVMSRAWGWPAHFQVEMGERNTGVQWLSVTLPNSQVQKQCCDNKECVIQSFRTSWKKLFWSQMFYTNGKLNEQENITLYSF